MKHGGEGGGSGSIQGRYARVGKMTEAQILTMAITVLTIGTSSACSWFETWVTASLPAPLHRSSCVWNCGGITPPSSRKPEELRIGLGCRRSKQPFPFRTIEYRRPSSRKSGFGCRYPRESCEGQGGLTCGRSSDQSIPSDGRSVVQYPITKKL
jgi:hypothetical protein